jgi:toxin FitB
LIVYLIDTNVISELRKTRPHRGVLAWIGTIAPGELSLSAVSLGEIQTGIEITRRQDPGRAAEIEGWADHIVATWNILPMDFRAFRLHAKLMHRQPDVLNNDAMIAATALVQGLTIATRNERDFKLFGVPVVNPFAYTE